MLTRKKQLAKLFLETLEARNTPSSSIGPGGALTIEGSNAADTVVVDNYDLIVAESEDGLNLIIPTYRVRENGSTSYFPVWEVTNGEVIFLGRAGNDRFTNATGQAPGTTGLRTHADGGAGNDILRAGIVAAGRFSHVLLGGTGNDTLLGSQAEDNLAGGDGNDYLYGAGAFDVLEGGAGDDGLFGAAGNDELYGGTGRDLLDGDEGADVLDGGIGDGPDQLRGSLGADRFRRDPLDVILFTLNWDNPEDFNAAEGDTLYD